MDLKKRILLFYYPCSSVFPVLLFFSFKGNTTFSLTVYPFHPSWANKQISWTLNSIGFQFFMYSSITLCILSFGNWPRVRWGVNSSLLPRSSFISWGKTNCNREWRSSRREELEESYTKYRLEKKKNRVRYI